MSECGPSGCNCKNSETCTELLQYKKLVYCSVYDCAFNISVQPKFVKHHRDWKPLGPEDAYKGICGRSEIGISELILKTRDGLYRPAECRFRSDTKIKGHVDFSKFLTRSDGSPHGGNISPSAPGDTAYH